MNDCSKVITIKGALPTLNEYIQIERGNRYAAAKVKKTNTDLVSWQVKKYKLIDYKVDVKCEWHTTRKVDPDNIAFGKKFILDGLVKGGVLKNDSQKYIGVLTDVIVKDDIDYCIIELSKHE